MKQFSSQISIEDRRIKKFARMDEIKMENSEAGRRASCVSAFSSISLVSIGSDGSEGTNLSTKTMPLSPLERLVKIQSEAEFYLRSAMMNERARRWNKVVDDYQTMLKLISRRNMPPGFTITDSYVLLLYESFYHLGGALQNLGKHRESIKAYTQSLKTVNIHKNGCLAGCNANSCFQTPVLAKRAFANAKVGDMKNAFSDIEKAVVLDTRNPDLYCIRALLWNTNKDTEKAVDDLSRALRYNPCHVCALLLRGSIDQPFRITFNFLEGLSLHNNAKEMKKDHLKAKQINPQAVRFLDIMDIHSPKIIDLWNRFLWSLNVPRNIVHAELMEGYDSKLAAQHTDAAKGKPSLSRSTTPIIQVNGVPDPSFGEDEENAAGLPRNRCPSPPFRCGTPTIYKHASNARRRHSYGEALRTYSNVLKAAGFPDAAVHPRPQTAASTRSFRPCSPSPVPPSVLTRPSSERLKQPRPSVTFSQPLLMPPNERKKGTVSAPPSLVRPQSRRSSITPEPPTARRASLAAVPTTTLSLSSDLGSRVIRTRQDIAIAKKRTASQHAHRVHGLRVFEPLNLDDAPRMYYKPWTGDKLPVVDVPRKQLAAAFRV